MTRIVSCVLVFVCAVFVGSVVSVAAQRAMVPLSSAVEERLAQQAISPDGREVTFRAAAADDIRVCVEQREGVFGPRRCFTLGQVRRGDVGVK